MCMESVLQSISVYTTLQTHQGEDKWYRYQKKKKKTYSILFVWTADKVLAAPYNTKK